MGKWTSGRWAWHDLTRPTTRDGVGDMSSPYLCLRGEDCKLITSPPCAIRGGEGGVG